VDNEDGEGDIDTPVQFRGEANRVGLAPVGPDTWQETLRPESLPQMLKHLLLYINGNHRTGVPSHLRELAGEEPRSAAEVEDAVAGLHVPLCEPVRAIDEPAQPGIEVPGAGCGEHLVVPGFPDLVIGGHECEMYVN
jgi:hypothetical protein